MTTDSSAAMAVRRILLALDSTEDAEAVEAATFLAEAMRAHLETLFVEDPDLLRLASLPFTREVSLVSATARPLRAEELARQLRVRSANVRRLLENGAVEKRFEWSFRITRDRPVHAAREAGTGIDLLIFGRAAGRALPLSGARRIVVVLGHEPDGMRTAEVALRLAERTGMTVEVIAPTDGDTVRKRNADIAQQAVTRGVDVSVSPLPAPADQLARLAAGWNASLVVLQDAPEFRQADTFHTLLRSMPCPLILVQ